MYSSRENRCDLVYLSHEPVRVGVFTHLEHGLGEALGKEEFRRGELWEDDQDAEQVRCARFSVFIESEPV